MLINTDIKKQIAKCWANSYLIFFIIIVLITKAVAAQYIELKQEKMCHQLFQTKTNQN